MGAKEESLVLTVSGTLHPPFSFNHEDQTHFVKHARELSSPTVYIQMGTFDLNANHQGLPSPAAGLEHAELAR